MQLTKKKTTILALALILCTGIASAAVLEYFGRIETTVNVKQAVLLDGQDYTTPIIEPVPDNIFGGDSFWRLHYLQSQTSVPVNLLLETSYSPSLTDSEIITTYHFANASTAIKGADRLVELQSSSDAGWDWNVTGLTAHSGSASPTNIYGVTALGLLEAYKLTGNSSYLDAAKKVADAIVAGKSQRTDGSIRSPDYRFLVEYGLISGDSTYISYARSKWDSDVANVKYYASPEAMYNHLATTWMDDTGIDVWELSNFGLSAFAVKDTDWANKAADVVASYSLTINDSDDYRFVGWGNALRFLCTVNATKYSEKITSLVSLLESKQLSNGSWNSDTQDTAYAIMGLNLAGAIDSAKRGVEWLVTTQQSNGGWSDGSEYSEVDSEAIQALPITLTQVTLLPYEHLNFYITYEFAVNIYPYTYTITTTVKPAP
jgi:hypothetical protein